MVSGPVALLSSASYQILVHRLTVYAPRFLPTLGRPRAVALRFARRDQLATGLAPVGVRPCWAHIGIGGSLLDYTPATPPGMRVRTRRFEKLRFM